MRQIDADKMVESVTAQYDLLKMIADGDETLNQISDLLLRCFLQEIANAPTIDAELVRHGHWINHYDDIWPEESTMECSLCHEEQGIAMLDTNYCPHCGAKMDEVSE